MPINVFIAYSQPTMHYLFSQYTCLEPPTCKSFNCYYRLLIMAIYVCVIEIACANGLIEVAHANGLIEIACAKGIGSLLISKDYFVDLFCFVHLKLPLLW